MANARWYPHPEESGSHAQWNIHRQILDHVYQLNDRLDKLDAQQKGATAKPSPASPATGPGSSSHTTIAGIAVKGTTPANGNTIRYNATSGQFEFGA
jgi:hypothetical protein